MEPIAQGMPEAAAATVDGVQTQTSQDTQPVVQPQVTTPEPNVDQAASSRLQQQLAKTNQLLTAIGIDPESDLADRYRAGLVTKDQLIAHIAPTAPQTSQPQQPNPKMRIAELKAKASKGEATQEDFAEFMDLTTKMYDTIEEQSRAEQGKSLVEQCKGAVTSVLSNDPQFQQLPDEIKRLENQIFLASTDMMVAQEANGDQSFFNPRAYNYYAQRNIDNIAKLRTHYIELGKKMQAQALSPAATINPISASSGGPPHAQAQPRITAKNWKAAASSYLARQGQV